MLKNVVLGFSLIELLIVIAIISILASIAIPSYQHYALQARFTEVIMATQPYKIAVALAIQEGIPRENLENGQYGIPDSTLQTQHVRSITVKKGIIMAVSSKLLNKVTYILTPDATGSVWTVSGTCVKAHLCST